ncbi:undecaprenyl-phosphate glucose phosphotransferase [Nitrosovibrio tenuis]|uniref:Putative colanic acid biosysnthesis UDP-glucose lipid carrier transferase n=2 Tax=Nitrosovibrio tenuis TaxID=1233 RepID=A0A1H7S2Q9_9PROT|nr:undecaprenyl-phosphate glucose phosphotransferase [Nitrosovibrio tenuis]SEL66755.1 putative colanic acid biosysnthesis UDP-glucose lipid carrier transferase [Nitrosovibrio tenuis]
MAEANPTFSASTVSASHTQGPLGNNMLSAVESILDPAMLTLSLWLVSAGIEGQPLPPYLILGVIVFSITFPGASRLQFSIKRLVFDVLYSWFWVALLLFFLGFATGYIAEFSSHALMTWLWAAPMSQIGAHLALRAAAPYLLMLQGPAQRAIIVGMNEQGIALASRIHGTRYSRIELSGFFDDRSQDRLHEAATQETQHGQLLGRLRELPHFVKENRIQFIYLSLPMASQPRILHVLDELKDTTASIYFVPDMFITDLIQGRSGTVCGMPVISVCESPFTGSNGFIKRASDIILSLLILTLIAPLLLLIAIAIKMNSPGPIIFKQRRYGLDGEEILVYKFRSMRVCEDGETIRQAQKGDSRITPIGAFLRQNSLDELPQFVNVLQGRMSIVGPRPHAVAHNEIYRNLIKGYMIRHKVKPGITGWAQVNGYRGETRTLDKMQARIDHDLDYLRNWSLRLDLHIILKTILVVLKDRAAY